ncbi:MAG: hypothetical protein WKF37_21410 [Bryobacteraceae bacterium]
MPGVAYGFFESYLNDRRALFHTGGGEHESILCLLPEENLGFYLVYSGELEKNFVQAFLDHYYPAAHPLTLPGAPPDFGQRAEQFTGLYRPNFIASRSIEKLAGLIADTRVTSNGDGTLTVGLPPFASKKLRIVEVEPLLFRSEEGFYATFARDRKENITGMFMSGSTKDPAAYDRLRWYESGLLHAGLGLAGFLVFLSLPLVSMIGFVRRHLRKAPLERQPMVRQLRLAWGTALLVSMLVLLSPAPILAWMLIGDHSRPSQFKSRFLFLWALSCLPRYLAWHSRFSYIVWRRGCWSVARQSLGWHCCIPLIPFLHHWNLLRL